MSSLKLSYDLVECCVGRRKTNEHVEDIGSGPSRINSSLGFWENPTGGGLLAPEKKKHTSERVHDDSSAYI